MSCWQEQEQKTATKQHTEATLHLSREVAAMELELTTKKQRHVHLQVKTLSTLHKEHLYEIST
jgi:hypothetical protein